jgi:prepilin-type N-terminal cleavage/methylation domain-containing protein
MDTTKRNKQKGFTLIELMVGIAIVGLLSSVILVATKGSTNKANIAKTMQWSRSIESLLGPYAVGIWNFDEGSGTTVSDLSGYGNDGTIYGATWRCAEDDFDGADDYVNGNEINISNSAYTISAWIKRDINDDIARSFFSIGSETGTRTAIVMRSYSGTIFRFGMWGDDLNVTFEENIINKWVYITGTLDDNLNMKLYLNGEIVGSKTAGGFFTGNDFWSIGSWVPSNSEKWSGQIDNVRIYD